MKIKWAILTSLLVSLTAPLSASADGFNEPLFQKWVAMRTGTGDPVYWYSTGTIRSYPDGKLVARIEGYDTGRVVWDEVNANKALQLSRKVYMYRDPETGEIMKDKQGNQVEPIAYPYQLISYELKGDDMITWVEQGAGDTLQKIGPGSDILPTETGGGTIFNAPLFLDYPGPDGTQYEAFENYDFFEPDADGGNGRFITFLRFGDAPPWADADKIVMHLVTWRTDDFNEIPDSMRSWVTEDAPLWREPPKDLAEIRELQKGN